MSAKLPNINCKHFRNGACMHHAAPQRWFGKPQCILLTPSTDPRIKQECALQRPYTRPAPPPMRPFAIHTLDASSLKHYLEANAHVITNTAGQVVGIKHPAPPPFTGVESTVHRMR